uniref:E3 ubiquitin-protein ligase RGLG2 n=1 Tax=Rhizophora mucronata TaxID=61149 RepID=A0A2P2LX44_RHIMU
MRNKIGTNETMTQTCKSQMRHNLPIST